MAQYVLAGTAGCPKYARAEILADDLSINLPDFKVHKIVLSDGEWKEWLKNTCSQHGWKHSSSPLVWRELVDRGGAGTYLGGWDDFKKMADHWYSYSDGLDDGSVKDISSENKTGYERDKAASIKTPVTPVHISVIGAALPIAYQLLPLLFDSCFKDQNLAIILQDVPDHAQELEGIKMELDDCSYGELHSVTVTHCMKNAASKADYLVILDPLDNNSHPDRFQLLKTSSLLYKDIATAIKGIVKPEAKIVINGYKACLGGMLLRHHGVTSDNISVVVTLDEQRMRAKLAKKLMVMPSDISGITVWGNVPVHHVASTAIGTVRNHEGAITGPGSYNKTVMEAVNEETWEFANVQSRDDRDKKICEMTGRNANISSALAIYRHIKSLVKGSESTTMGCLSTGQYGTKPGCVFGFPVSVTDGAVTVKEVEGIPEKLREIIDLQNEQLGAEKKVALGECDDIENALNCVEQTLWTILETPKLKKLLDEKEGERKAKEEADKKAADIKAKEEAKRKAEEEALKKAEEEAAAAAAAAAAEEEEEIDYDAD